MKYLLDTMVWLWSVGPAENIGTAGLDILGNGREEIYLSAASSWEIAIKAKLGKFRLPEAPGPYVRTRMAAQRILPLPVIIAQALDEGMVILTSDHAFKKYPVELVWCGK
jgi:PIN domain nuclease of toxin-antitoxin system